MQTVSFLSNRITLTVNPNIVGIKQFLRFVTKTEFSLPSR